MSRPWAGAWRTRVAVASWSPSRAAAATASRSRCPAGAGPLGYRWLRGLDQAPLPEVPTALRARLDPDPSTMTRPADPTTPPVPGHPYGRTVLAAELAALGRATPGRRNHTLNRCAFKVYRYVGGGVLDDQDVTLAFTTVALAIGLDRAEISRTLVSARTAGLANPRSVPAAPDPGRQEVGA
jgi:hypothetical protein